MERNDGEADYDDAGEQGDGFFDFDLVRFVGMDGRYDVASCDIDEEASDYSQGGL